MKGMRIRFETKPGKSRASAGSLPRSRASSTIAAAVSAEVSGPRSRSPGRGRRPGRRRGGAPAAPRRRRPARSRPPSGRRRRRGRARASRAEANRVGWRESTREGDVAYARAVTFEGVDRDRIGQLTRQLQEDERPEEIPATEIVLLYDADGEKSLVLVFFENEDDYRRGDAALHAMDPGETPGK